MALKQDSPIDPLIIQAIDDRLGDGVGSIEWRSKHVDMCILSTVQGCLVRNDGYRKLMNSFI